VRAASVMLGIPITFRMSAHTSRDARRHGTAFARSGARFCRKVAAAFALFVFPRSWSFNELRTEFVTLNSAMRHS